VWLVLPDPFSTRIFADCGVLEGLHDALGERLRPVVLMSSEQTSEWERRLGQLDLLERDALFPLRVGNVERATRRVDLELDRRIGFYPQAVRFNLRHGFHRERMRSGHRNLMLDLDRKGVLPDWPVLDAPMRTWLYGKRRYVPHALFDQMRAECGAVAFANVQTQPAVPFLAAGRRLRIPMVGYVASWDHAVGKGVISPHLQRYVVQNEIMRGDLARYHQVDSGRVVVTGWPQTDVYHRRRSREAYETILRSCGLDTRRPLVIVMGNTPTNAPYEHRFVARMLTWWEQSGGRGRFSLLFRPHPRDREWETRFAAARDTDGVHVQQPSYTDLDVLATLLQHAGCVVANAGTILLDSLVNDRPAVCVIYDEDAPPGERWAAMNVLGEHYRQLMESAAFYRAHDFDEVASGIERALANPDELAEERRRVAEEVVGEVDGRAAERVVAAIVEIVARAS
jgi:hypothetical protein